MQREKITLGWSGKSAAVADITFVELADPAPAPPAIPKDVETNFAPWTVPDPLELCLELWKTWMAGDADRDLGAKTMRGLRGEGDGHGLDLYEAQHVNDICIAKATDAMIDSLPRLHAWAIYVSCSIGTVWIYPNANLPIVAAEARAELRLKLRRNICTSTLF